MSQLTTVKEKRAWLVNFLKSRETEMRALLPKYLTPERMVGVVGNAVVKNPDLLNCTPASLVGAVMGLCELGLEPSIGQAYLVPFRDQCSLIIGYKGLITLATRSGKVLDIEPYAVRKGDKFEYHYGMEPHLLHRPKRNSSPDDPITHVYAIAWLDGLPKPTFRVMTRGDVEHIRKRYSRARTSPWDSEFEAMAMKTVVRQLCKYLPVDVHTQRAIEQEERAEVGLPQDYEAEFTVVDLPEDDTSGTQARRQRRRQRQQEQKDDGAEEQGGGEQPGAGAAE